MNLAPLPTLAQGVVFFISHLHFTASEAGCQPRYFVEH